MGRASTTRASRSRTSATWARLRVRFSLAPARSASRATTMAPALCRVLPYSSSGLPSPSTIQGPPSSPAPVTAARLRSWRGTGRLALGPVLALAGVLGRRRLAALADPGRLPDQPHRHLDLDLLAPADLDEVDVDEVAPDRVALDLLGQGQVLVAADLQRDQHVGAGVGAQGLAELAGVDAQVLGAGAVAVQHGRGPAGGPPAAGGPLPGVRAVLGGQLVLGHGGRASSERVGAHSDARPGPGTTARVAVLRR